MSIIIVKKISELRLLDLKAEIEKRGLDESGSKVTLIKRLTKAMEGAGDHSGLITLKKEREPSRSKSPTPIKIDYNTLNKNLFNETRERTTSSERRLNLDLLGEIRERERSTSKEMNSDSRRIVRRKGSEDRRVKSRSGQPSGRWLIPQGPRRRDDSPTKHSRRDTSREKKIFPLKPGEMFTSSGIHVSTVRKPMERQSRLLKRSHMSSDIKIINSIGSDHRSTTPNCSRSRDPHMRSNHHLVKAYTQKEYHHNHALNRIHKQRSWSRELKYTSHRGNRYNSASQQHRQEPTREKPEPQLSRSGGSHIRDHREVALLNTYSQQMKSEMSKPLKKRRSWSKEQKYIPNQASGHNLERSHMDKSWNLKGHHRLRPRSGDRNFHSHHQTTEVNTHRHGQRQQYEMLYQVQQDKSWSGERNPVEKHRSQLNTMSHYHRNEHYKLKSSRRSDSRDSNNRSHQSSKIKTHSHGHVQNLTIPKSGGKPRSWSREKSSTSNYRSMLSSGSRYSRDGQRNTKDIRRSRSKSRDREVTSTQGLLDLPIPPRDRMIQCPPPPQISDGPSWGYLNQSRELWGTPRSEDTWLKEDASSRGLRTVVGAIGNESQSHWGNIASGCRPGPILAHGVSQSQVVAPTSMYIHHGGEISRVPEFLDQSYEWYQHQTYQRRF